MVVGTAEPVRVEPDLAVDEDEVRREVEANNRARIVVLIACAVDPEIVVVREPLRMGQQHDADGERAETELTLVDHDLACPANRATAMLDTELGGDHEDVGMTLLLRDLPQRSFSASRLTQTIGTELTVTVVVERTVTTLLDQDEHADDVVIVGAREGRFGTPEVRNRELAFGTIRHIASEIPDGRAVAQFGKKPFLQHLDLVMDQNGLLVAGEVSVA